MTFPLPLVNCACGVRLYTPLEKIHWCERDDCPHTTVREPTQQLRREWKLPEMAEQ